VLEATAGGWCELDTQTCGNIQNGLTDGWTNGSRRNPITRLLQRVRVSR
jgi:hypothetical protein